MPTKHLLTIIKTLLFVLVIGTPLFYYPWGVYPYTLAKQEFFQAVVEIAGFLWLALITYVPKYRPRRTPLVTLGAVFLGLLLVASFTGVDPWRSLWSTYERGVGVIAFFHLALLGLMFSSLYEEIPWRKLFFASLCVSLLTVVIALIQLHIPDFLLGENPGARPGATFGNPIFLSGYLLFHVFLGAYLILDLLRDSDCKLTGTDWGLVVCAFLAAGFDILGIFIGQTRGDILALAAGLMVLLGLYSIRPPQIRITFLRSRWTYAGCLLVILLTIGIFAFTFRSDFWSRVPGASRFQALLISFSVENSSIAPRVYALDAGWKGFLDRPWLGWGPENFTTVSSKYYNPRQLEQGYGETRFDKPHNFILEYLVSGGILLLLGLSGLFGAVLYEAFRGKNKFWSPVFVAAISAYVVGEFFEFETIGPLLMLYLFFGFTDGSFRYRHNSLEVEKKPTHGKESMSVSRGVFWSVLALGCIFAYVINAPSVFASYYQYEGFTDFLHQNIPAGLNDFGAALTPWSPYRWNFIRDSTAAILGQYFNYPGSVSDADALAALARAEQVRDEHPMDSYDHYSLINFYNEISRIDPQKYTALAEQEAHIALELSPNRQEVYFLLAKTKTIEKDYPGALALLKTARDLDLKVADGHFYYGVLAFAIGDMTAEYHIPEMKIGYDEIKQAMQIKRQWKTYHESKTVADNFADFYVATKDKAYLEEASSMYKVTIDMNPGDPNLQLQLIQAGDRFANAGHLDLAISIYATVLGVRPSDPETQIKLGVAYYYLGRTADAKNAFMGVISETDITKSSEYASVKPILNILGILPQHP